MLVRPRRSEDQVLEAIRQARAAAARWDLARSGIRRLRCANICWWARDVFVCDYTVTPRPMYLSGRAKLPIAGPIQLTAR